MQVESVEGAPWRRVGRVLCFVSLLLALTTFGELVAQLVPALATGGGSMALRAPWAVAALWADGRVPSWLATQALLFWFKPLAGICIGVGAVGMALFANWGRKLAVFGLCALLLALSIGLAGRFLHFRELGVGGTHPILVVAQLLSESGTSLLLPVLLITLLVWPDMRKAYLSENTALTPAWVQLLLILALAGGTIGMIGRPLIASFEWSTRDAQELPPNPIVSVPFEAELHLAGGILLWLCCTTMVVGATAATFGRRSWGWRALLYQAWVGCLVNILLVVLSVPQLFFVRETGPTDDSAVAVAVLVVRLTSLALDIALILSLRRHRVASSLSRSPDSPLAAAPVSDTQAG